MRLEVVDSGHEAPASAALAKLREMLGVETSPGVTATLLYRPEFFGLPMSEYLQPVSRGPSDWSVGERELMAAFVSKLNHCPW